MNPQIIYQKILPIMIKHHAVYSSASVGKLAWDIVQLNCNIEHVKYLARNFSPSQLGRMGYLGIRRLAQLRRDEGVNRLEALLRDLEKVVIGQKVDSGCYLPAKRRGVC